MTSSPTSPAEASTKPSSSTEPYRLPDIGEWSLWPWCVRGQHGIGRGDTPEEAQRDYARLTALAEMICVRCLWSHVDHRRSAAWHIVTLAAWGDLEWPICEDCYAWTMYTFAWGFVTSERRAPRQEDN